MSLHIIIIKTITSSKQNIVVFAIIVTFLTSTVIFLKTINKVIEPYETLLHYHTDIAEKLRYYEADTDNSLPSADHVSFTSENQIFFHEISNKGGLDSREACAVESAARNNLNWNINVLFAGPVNAIGLNSATLKTLQEFENVKLYRIHPFKYISKSPLESLITKTDIHNSAYPVSHALDILKFLTLYKHGGLHLDLNLVVLTSFDSLSTNFITNEFNACDFINLSALRLSLDKEGKQFSQAVLRELLMNFNSKQYEETNILCKTLKNVCSKEYIDSTQTCFGVELLSPEYFLPLNWANVSKITYINPKESYAVHLWDKVSYRVNMPKNSVYAQIAKIFCPSIFNLYKENFGH